MAARRKRKGPFKVWVARNSGRGADYHIYLRKPTKQEYHRYTIDCKVVK